MNNSKKLTRLNIIFNFIKYNIIFVFKFFVLLLLHSWPPVSFSLTDLIPLSKFVLAITSSFIYFFTKRYLLYVKNIYWSGESSSNNNKKLSHYSIKTNDILKKNIWINDVQEEILWPSKWFGPVCKCGCCCFSY